MPANRYVLKKEKAMTNGLARLFRRQQNQFIAFLESMDKQKDFHSIDDMIELFISETSSAILDRLRPVITKGADVNAKKYKNEGFRIQWEVQNNEGINYLTALNNLILSNRDGSIGQTIKDEILSILKNGIIEGLSPTEIGEGIRLTNPFVFSKSRSELIAVTEVGRAYEYGNYLPMKDLQNKGEVIIKKWSTVGDDKVRPTHSQNEADGWISLDKAFSGTGDQTAPAKLVDPFRCRCSTLYLLE